MVFKCCTETGELLLLEVLLIDACGAILDRVFDEGGLCSMKGPNDENRDRVRCVEHGVGAWPGR